MRDQFESMNEEWAEKKEEERGECICVCLHVCVGMLRMWLSLSFL